MFTSPSVPSARAREREHSSTRAVMASLRLYGGVTAMESPECMPARSMCSMMPGTSTRLPSDMTSHSSSVPGRYWSISTFAPLPAVMMTSM